MVNLHRVMVIADGDNALIGLGFTFYMNNQPKHEKTNPKKKVESLELIKPKSRHKFFTDI